jgi:dihydroneopterin aldolase
MRVTVRVEKLELGAGGVGVEIERKRARQQQAALRPGATASDAKDFPGRKGVTS